MLYEAINNSLSRVKRIKPITLALQITEKCNAKCIMCNIWEEGISSGVELSIYDYNNLFQSTFFSNITAVILTGGEALLRPDIDEIISILRQHLPKLKKITIATNGISTDFIIKKLTAIATQMESTQKKGLQLVIQVSYDGMSSIHDKIRGIPKANEKVKKTLEELLILRQKFSFLKISIGCVIQALNIDEIEQVFHFFKKQQIETVFPVVCQDEHYYKNDSDSIFLFNNSQLIKVKKVLLQLISIEPNIGKKKLYSDFKSMLEGKNNSRACPSLRDTVTIEPNGNIIPCMNSNGNILGNIKDSCFEHIWFSKKSKSIAEEIKNNTCPKCMFACGVSYYEVLIYSLLRLINKNL